MTPFIEKYGLFIEILSSFFPPHFFVTPNPLFISVPISPAAQIGRNRSSGHAGKDSRTIKGIKNLARGRQRNVSRFTKDQEHTILYRDSTGNLNNLENKEEKRRKKSQAREMNIQEKLALIYKCCKHVKKY